MDFSRILILIITLHAFGLGLAGLSHGQRHIRSHRYPNGMDIADLKSSMDAILGDKENLRAKAKKAKDPMVRYMAKNPMPSLGPRGVGFWSYEKTAFIKEMSEQKDLDTAWYWSDEFLKRMIDAATGDENWNLFAGTVHNGIPMYYGDVTTITNWMVRWNAKISKVDLVIFDGFLYPYDPWMLYSFEGTARLPQGKIYEDSQIMDPKYKPMTAAGFSVSDQKSWFDMLQLKTMLTLKAQLKNGTKAQSASVRFLQKASSG
jgi:hypothetical protein